jgi:lipoate-protein ligase A
MNTCRVIDLPRNDGLFNTVIDEYFLLQNELDFVILFTKWHPTVSVGNSQSVALDINLNAVKKYALNLARRRSGGQSVLVDEHYIVFSVIGKRQYFPQDLTLLRKQVSESVASVLRRFNVPAEYYEPDNIIIRNPKIQTLGNAAQIVKQHAVAVHGSVRYSLSEESLGKMVETLMINGVSLEPYREDIRKVLGCVSEFTETGKEEIKTAILQKLIELYGFRDYRSDTLSETEERGIRSLSPNPIADKPGYRSRGVCHLNLNGKCLIALKDSEQ